MEYLNINQTDRSKLTLVDKNKLIDYDVVPYEDFKVGDHFRYTSNKYQIKGRKLAYGVIHGNDIQNRVMEVNGYTNDDEQKYPNWKIEVDNRYKQYVFYKKVRTNYLR